MLGKLYPDCVLSRAGAWPGWMKVRPIYLLFTKPTPWVCRSAGIAEGGVEAGVRHADDDVRPGRGNSSARNAPGALPCRVDAAAIYDGVRRAK